MSRVGGAATVVDATGLHARPAVKLTKLAKTFDAHVEVMVGDTGKWVSAKSPNAVMKLKAKHGETLHLRADGVDADAALAALLSLVERNFGD